MKEAIKEAEFDYCVLTGDYRYRSFGSMALALKGLDLISDAVDSEITAIMGNHDSIEMVPYMESIGMKVLLNENHVISKNDHSLLLIGVDDPSSYRLDDLTRAVHPYNTKESSAILLAHSPHLIKEAQSVGISAYLCGHTHGGQICLPGGYPIAKRSRSLQRFLVGQWEYQGMQGYTSSGAGVSIVNARYFCPPEITVHSLSAL